MDRSTNLDNSRTENINNSKSKDMSRVEKNMNVCIRLLDAYIPFPIHIIIQLNFSVTTGRVIKSEDLMKIYGEDSELVEMCSLNIGTHSKTF